MNFSPNSTSLPPLSRDGLRIQSAAEILHHLPLADRSHSGRSHSGHRVNELPYIEIRETAQQPEIPVLQDPPQVRTPTARRRPAHLRPT